MQEMSWAKWSRWQYITHYAQEGLFRIAKWVHSSFPNSAGAAILLTAMRYVKWHGYCARYLPMKLICDFWRRLREQMRKDWNNSSLLTLLDRVLLNLRLDNGLDKEGNYAAWCIFHPDSQGEPPYHPNLSFPEQGFNCFAYSDGSLRKLFGVGKPKCRVWT